jgi:hypothetical protein
MRPIRLIIHDQVLHEKFSSLVFNTLSSLGLFPNLGILQFAVLAAQTSDMWKDKHTCVLT